MEYRFAQSDDLSKWAEAADDVAEIMRVPNMGTNKSFLEYAKRKLKQNETIMAYDKENRKCAGFIGFSRHNNSITCLGVKGAYRNQGIGSRLLSSALNELDKSKTIIVHTYPDHYPPGLSARKLYFRHGFKETSGEIFIHEGLEMVELSILPTR